MRLRNIRLPPARTTHLSYKFAIALFPGQFTMWTAVNGLWSQWKQRLPTSVQGLPRFDLLPSLRNRRKNPTEILLMSFDLVWSFSSSGHCIAFVSYLVWWCNSVELRVKTAFLCLFFRDNFYKYARRIRLSRVQSFHRAAKPLSTKWHCFRAPPPSFSATGVCRFQTSASLLSEIFLNFVLNQKVPQRPKVQRGFQVL